MFNTMIGDGYDGTADPSWQLDDNADDLAQSFEPAPGDVDVADGGIGYNPFRPALIIGAEDDSFGCCTGDSVRSDKRGLRG